MYALTLLHCLLLSAVPNGEPAAASLPNSFASPVFIRAGIALVSCLIGVVVALVAGILVKRSQRLSVAILAAGGALAATTTLCILLFSFVLNE